MSKWEQLADEQTIQKTIAALKENGIQALVVENSEEAKQQVLKLIPEGSEVMTMTSVTVNTIGLDVEINESGHFDAIRNKLYAMDRETQAQEMNRLGAAPAFALGSVHAVTEDGHVLIASMTGSQLPAYAYSAGKVIWVVGTHKIVENVDDGIHRIYEYVFPLEDQRAQQAYGVNSGVNKILMLNKEINPARITLIFVKEKLGF
ncbi:hypothetical protein FJZ31_34725 [Candidatus Poribacteria bacterium]|nr:hypothetical protein [Candidatus Poribacteria bacterium]